MLNFIKRNIFIILMFLITLIVSFITFLTFIDKSFIPLNEKNLNLLLLINIGLLLFFFIVIFLEIKNSFKNNINIRGSIANRKYIIFFSSFTLMPSLLISVFSLFLFSFALEKYFDNKITTAVNNSYELAKNYIDEKRNKIEADIVLIAFDLTKNFSYFQNNKQNLVAYLNTQKIIRDVDEIHLINNSKKLIASTKDDNYIQIDDKAFNMVINDNRPLKIINAYQNTSAALLKIPNIENTFIYIIKFLDEDISKYLQTSEEAINFYYTVDDNRTGIKISFALIYVLVVSLLLFLSISIAIRFSSRFFISINNLISASDEIGKGNLNTKVPDIKADIEMELLNKNFNLMIDKLKSQQEKLILSERHSAWENVARKLAHEIKNPLTPIQLTIDNLKSKYSRDINKSNLEKFNQNLQTIQNQIKQIETLVNEFSDFARMPSPLIKKNNLAEIINSNIILLQKMDDKIKINFVYKKDNNFDLLCDYEQISRVIFNLIKNSIESINEKYRKNDDFLKIIDIEIDKINDYIVINIIDNGTGFLNKTTDDLIKPYFTTKKNGSGLGLSIVNKIINDHDGTIKFSNEKDGAKVSILLPHKIN